MYGPAFKHKLHEQTTDKFIIITTLSTVVEDLAVSPYCGTVCGYAVYGEIHNRDVSLGDMRLSARTL